MHGLNPPPLPQVQCYGGDRCTAFIGNGTGAAAPFGARGPFQCGACPAVNGVQTAPTQERSEKEFENEEADWYMLYMIVVTVYFVVCHMLLLFYVLFVAACLD